MALTPAKQKTLTTLDKHGPYFQKTVGVLGQQSDEVRKAATVYVARHAKSRDDFDELVATLGLDDVAKEMSDAR